MKLVQHVKADNMIQMKVAEKNRWGLNATRVAHAAMDCLKGYMTGSLSPGNMISEHLWKVALPQYLMARYD